VRAVCDLTPTALRQRARTRFKRGEGGASGAVPLRLPVRTPFAYEGLFGHLAASAVPGVEEVRDGAYRRTLCLPNGSGIVSLTPQPDHVQCQVVLDDFRDLATAIARCRRLLDLDADPEAVVDALGADADLSVLVAKAPGQRIPRTVDEQELALRVVLGQQVSLKAARTHARRIVTAYGQPVADVNGGLTHVFPSIAQLAEIDPAHLAFPKSRQRSLITLIRALADGDVVLDPGCDWDRARKQLQALPGIGPWSAEVIAMRGLGDPDAFPVSDLGVRLAAKQLGLPSDPRPLTERSARWRPWRSYATQHLWTALDHAVNEWPPKEKSDGNTAISLDGQPRRCPDLGRQGRPVDAPADGRSDLRAQP
jgi:AraC family transcriptional regulator, regulatory protein of adaptative response / DNA-3-methyladenine glycosylase II